MLQTTLEVLKSVLKADPTLTVEDRTRLIETVTRGGVKPEAKPERLLRRNEVASRLGVCTRTVDNLRKSRALQAVKFPGRTRGAGFRESDVALLMKLN